MTRAISQTADLDGGELSVGAGGYAADLWMGQVAGRLLRRFPRLRISISVENTFERDIVDREWLHGELRRQACEVAESLQKRGEVARTVTTKLRYADFSIRSRSTSLEVGIDDANRIAELACGLLDRGLHDRPGALRLVGVGVSGLAEYRQLTLIA